MAEPKAGPEIIFAVVGAVGADLDMICRCVAESLQDFSYDCAPLKLSELMHEVQHDPWKNLPNSPEFQRYSEHMTAGNKLRAFVERGDALAMLAVGAIRDCRQEKCGSPDQPAPRQAYVLKSLKHPAEVRTLRSIYGPSFFLIAGYCPREMRKQNLAEKLASSEYSLQPSQFFDKAESLMKRDLSERETDEYGQNVRDTFPVADVFVDASDPEDAKTAVRRFIDLIFAAEIHTPTPDEYGMFHAQAAALRSAALGRQVGATIATDAGDIIAVGTNEVPKAGGGLYWCVDDPDRRDFKLGYEVSDRIKRRVLGDVLGRLQKKQWLAADRLSTPIDDLVEEAFGDDEPDAIVKGSHLANSIEYFRAVHAEMAAIVDAARRGVSIKDGVLYTTTFPCHDCAKHIVAAGIQRAVYVEPYPKSLAPDLYLDSIVVDEPKRKSHSEGGAASVGYVRFESFVGVAPRQYMDLFAMGERKTATGDVAVPNKAEIKPRFAQELPPDLAGLVKETQEFQRFKEQLNGKIALATAPQKPPTSNEIKSSTAEVRRA